jgi:plastocyanin
MKLRPLRVGLALAMVGLAAPLAVASPASAGAPAQAGTTVKIDTGDNFFKPKTVTIEVGTTVKWTNTGRSVHSVTPNKGHKFGEDTLRPDADYSFTFNEPGTYPYYCTFHGAPGVGQHGTIKVTSPATPTTPTTSAYGTETTVPGPPTTAAKQTSGVIHVPADAPTIQAAVDRAAPGALVLVSPGVYKEAVTVTHPQIVIRGLDRNTTILDGGFTLDNGIKVIDADGVAVENMTARNFTANGFFWTGVKGYRGSYLTATRNGDYGIYAFDSTDGQFDNSYGSGSPDAGFYIGQCKQCNALMINDEAEWNGLGYSGTNAGGNLVITKSSFHNNRAGIAPNSETSEKYFPQKKATIVGNKVFDNNNSQNAAIELAVTARGNGILVTGGIGDIVERNLVTGHETSGIAIVPMPETITRPDAPAPIDFEARDNTVQKNVTRDNQYDLAFLTSIAKPDDPGGNCFSGNTFKTSLPDKIETLVPCGKPASKSYKGDLAKFSQLLLAEQPPSLDYTTVTLPDASTQKNMPKASSTKHRPATNEPSIKVDPNKVPVPKG